MLVVVIAVLFILAVGRSLMSRRPEQNRVVLPALPRSIGGSRGSMLTHVPLLLFLAGLPFFVLALADPFSSLVGQDVSYPGRRVALLIDASISMLSPFAGGALVDKKVGDRTGRPPTFYSTVGAAKRFVELRAQSKNRDLMSLIEFGDEAYVVTPFTNDYDNILLSISLIGDPVELGMFPDRGTLIGQAIEQSINLFRAFNFLDAAGNMMVIFTDGEDDNANVNGVDLDDIMHEAAVAKIPVYFVRTNWGKEAGSLVPDERWKPAVAKTGGRFFAAKDENSLLEAIADIDKVSTGTIQVRQYTSQRPQFALFTGIAIGCWVVGALLKLSVPYFQRLP